MMKTIKDYYYHVYNRSLENMLLFDGGADYRHFLSLVKKYSQLYSITINVYCLIPNHYHFLLCQQTDITISKFLQSLNNAYVQGVNKKRKRRGTLYQGKPQYRVVEHEYYLMHLCRYIHLNPIKHNVIKDINHWKYSNYHERIGTRKGSLFEPDFIPVLFTDKKLYQEFVEDYIPVMKDFSMLKDYSLEE